MSRKNGIVISVFFVVALVATTAKSSGAVVPTSTVPNQALIALNEPSIHTSSPEEALEPIYKKMLKDGLRRGFALAAQQAEKKASFAFMALGYAASFAISLAAPQSSNSLQQAILQNLAFFFLSDSLLKLASRESQLLSDEEKELIARELAHNGLVHNEFAHNETKIRPSLPPQERPATNQSSSPHQLAKPASLKKTLITYAPTIQTIIDEAVTFAIQVGAAATAQHVFSGMLPQRLGVIGTAGNMMLSYFGYKAGTWAFSVYSQATKNLVDLSFSTPTTTMSLN